jgi:hypothetical protein
MKDNQKIDSSMLNMLVDASGEFRNYASMFLDSSFEGSD